MFNGSMVFSHTLFIESKPGSGASLGLRLGLRLTTLGIYILLK